MISGIKSTTINEKSETSLLIPAAIAEISFMLWLLINGINESKVKTDNFINCTNCIKMTYEIKKDFI